MNKWKVSILTLAMVFMIAGAASAKSITAVINGLGHAEVGVWSIEVDMLVQNFVSQGVTSGAAVPGSGWDDPIERYIASAGDYQLFKVILTQNFTVLDSYLNKGELFTLDYTGTIVGIDTSIIYDDDAFITDMYKNPLYVYGTNGGTRLNIIPAPINQFFNTLLAGPIAP